MTKKTNSSFIDTDIIQKIGGFQGEKLLSRVLNSFEFYLFVHKYIAEEELILGGNAQDQFYQQRLVLTMAAGIDHHRSRTLHAYLVAGPEH